MSDETETETETTEGETTEGETTEGETTEGETTEQSMTLEEIESAYGPMLNEVKQELTVPLTSAEMVNLGERAGQLGSTIQTLEAEEKARKKRAAAEIKVLKDDLQEALDKLATQSEDREVVVQIRGDVHNNIATAVRLDTLQVVSERALESGERERLLQGEMPFPQGPQAVVDDDADEDADEETATDENGDPLPPEL